MSQENVEIVRRGWDAFFRDMNERNLDDVFAAVFDAGMFAPDATLSPSLDAAGSRTFVGRQGFIEWTRTWAEAFVDYRLQLEDVVDAGDEHVVLVVRQSATGRESGASVELRFGIVFTFKGGQVTEQRHYTDPAEAFKAVGLAE